MAKTVKRVARRLTRTDFLAAKRIGDVQRAHAQLGICKGTLYAWKKLKTWPKVLAHNAEMASKAKSKREPTVGRTVEKKANVAIVQENSLGKHLSNLSKAFNGLISFLKDNSVVVKKN
jgi:hypothetical protein